MKYKLSQMFMNRQIQNFLGSKVLIVLTGTVSQKLLALITTFFIARKLSTDAFGAYTLAMSVFLILVSVVQVGLPDSLVKYVSIAVSEGNDEKAASLTATSLLSVLFFSSVFGVSILVFSGTIVSYLESNLEFQNTILYIVFSVPLFVSVQIVASFLQGKGEVSKQQTLFLLRAIFFLSFCAMSVFAELSAERFCQLFLLANFATFLVACFFSYEELGKRRQIANFAEFQHTLKLGSIIFVNNVGWLLAATVDRFMLAKMSTFSDVGVYSLTSTLSANIAIGVAAMGMLVLPHCAVAYANGDRELLRKEYLRFTNVGYSVALVLGGAILLEGQPILALAGHDYEQAVFSLWVLVLTHCIVASGGPCGKLLVVCKLEKQALFSSIAQAGLNILLNYFLIPLYGVVGAALATLIAAVIARVYLYAVVYLKLGISAPDRIGLFITVAFSVAFYISNELGSSFCFRLYNVNLVEYAVYFSITMLYFGTIFLRHCYTKNRV